VCPTSLSLKGTHLLPSIIYCINSVLSRVVSDVPVGTRLGLCHRLWMLLSGRLRQGRGAVIPGLAAFGLSDAAVRRAWTALAYGRWRTSTLRAAWQKLVQDHGSWQAPRHGGDRPGEWPPLSQAASARAGADTGAVEATTTGSPRLSHCWASPPLPS
jgi:hypothetical protein